VKGPRPDSDWSLRHRVLKKGLQKQVDSKNGRTYLLVVRRKPVPPNFVAILRGGPWIRLSQTPAAPTRIRMLETATRSTPMEKL
jgi:hypothetical protein